MDARESSRTESRRIAFYLQYTCLMLIIVCFIVATRFQIHQESSHESSSLSPVVEVHEAPDFGAMEFDPLFEEDDSLNRDFAETIGLVLAEHDIQASFQQEVGENLSLEQSISRVMVLAKFLSERRLPAEAYEFRITDCSSDDCGTELARAEIKWSQVSK